MRLWQVSVEDVSQRYVWAESAVEAVQSVRRAIASALSVTAHAAPDVLDRAYKKAGPMQQKKLIAALDGLNPPSAMRKSTSDLVRLAGWDEAQTEWQLGQLAKAQPINPATARRLSRLAELNHVTALRRFRDRDDETSPLHTDSKD